MTNKLNIYSDQIQINQLTLLRDYLDSYFKIFKQITKINSRIKLLINWNSDKFQQIKYETLNS